MNPISNYDSIQASNGEFARPAAGGYICQIINATDVPVDPKSGKGNYLKIEYDIAEGELKDYYTEAYEKFNKWWASFIRSYKEKALGMFKHFTNCVEESNPGYKWDWNELSLRGKFIGLVIGEEEYLKQDGSVGTRLYVKDVKTVDQIERCDYIVPPLKRLSGAAAPVPVAAAYPAMTEDDSDLPWN